MSYKAPDAPFQAASSALVTIKAEPGPLEIDLKRAAIVVVDMQNAFVAKGAYSDLIGFDVSWARAVVTPIRKLTGAARSRGLKVVYLFTTHDPGDAGSGPDSVYWHKERSLATYREHPELRERLLLPGTWGAEIIPELKPEKADAVVEKPRYSGFFDTALDTVLKRYNLKYLFFAGVATNCCVESTIRDAYYRGYFPILVHDAAAASAREFMQEASVANVRSFFGWVATADDVMEALTQDR